MATTAASDGYAFIGKGGVISDKEESERLYARSPAGAYKKPVGEKRAGCALLRTVVGSK